MPRRKIAVEVAIDTPSAQREASRLANIFQSRLRNVQVGTTAGRGGGGAGGGGSKSSGGGGFGPFGNKNIGEFIGNTAGFALAGIFYKFFSDLPGNIAELDRLATANRRATASFQTLAGGTAQANAMIDAYIQGTGNVADRISATTDAMRLYNIGMADTAREMRIFTTLSRGMAQSLGRPVEYIQEQLSLALANQSMLRFDQLGLSIQRHQEIMEELGEQYPTLTREMLFQNAMIVQATDRYYDLALAQEALASNTEILNRQFLDQRAILGEIVSGKIMQPLAGQLAGMMGAQDINLQSAFFRNYAETERYFSQPSTRNGKGYLGGDIDLGITEFFETQYKNISAMFDPKQRGLNATVADSLVNAMNTAQATANLGVEVDPNFIEYINEVADALSSGAPATEEMRTRLNAMVMVMQMAAGEIDPLNDGLLEFGDALEVTAQKVDEVTGQMVGAATAMVGKLIAAGMNPNEAIEMVGSEKSIRARATEYGEAGAFQGDAIADAAAAAVLEESITGPAEAWLDAIAESERASKRAASELEQAAKEAEKAFLDAADSIVDAYDDMLQKIPGVFGTSEVTEEDLQLAELGLPVNYADDALRRLEDVAFNKTKRDDVDLAAWNQALRLPQDTDPRATAIFGRRAWESGELWANPENIGKFMNTDAAKGDLMGQEFAALGQQNLRAFFGLGTEQGKEFLRVFGVEALDPIQDGLITEITTRGPIMGETLANMMHQGFKSQALSLPWVQTLMDAVNSQVGRAILEGMNNNASSDTAEAEAIP